MAHMSALDLSVDRASEVPLGTQLTWKLRLLIATGTLAPGERLPGIREVAQAAGVNVNTVRAVFAKLEEQGIVSSKHGRGTFVAAEARPDENLAEAAAAVIAQAREAGIDQRELAAALWVSSETSSGDEERSQRRALYAQISELERALAPLDPLGTIAPTRPLAPSSAADAAPRMLTNAELRQTRDHLAARIDQLRRERDQLRAAIGAEEEELERPPQAPEPARVSRWRNGGVWTGGPAPRVSWTGP
jgi:DNA-binding transcriptional regulator YhcF (GntR family)